MSKKETERDIKKICSNIDKSSEKTFIIFLFYYFRAQMSTKFLTQNKEIRKRSKILIKENIYT